MASASFAQTAPSVYAGVDIGSSKADNANYDGSETSYGAFVGYNFNENFALEGGYRSLYDKDGVEATQVSLSGIATMPLSNGFNVYGRLGYNRLNVETNFVGVNYKEHQSKVLYGVGVGYVFTPSISGRVEYQKPNSDFSNLSAGLVFKF
jgi:OOP family OmpA-OmpF porin